MSTHLQIIITPASWMALGACDAWDLHSKCIHTIAFRLYATISAAGGRESLTASRTVICSHIYMESQPLGTAGLA